MRIRVKIMGVALAVLGVCLFASPTFADWDPGDGHKMHYPQMPDPQGWDVCLVCQWLADDFQCGESGPISDIHFWTSWRHDEVGDIPDQAWEIFIFDDAGGQPGIQLWQFSQGNIKTRWYGEGPQGWMCPSPPPLWSPNDHTNFYQVNITNIAEPFIQEQGRTYWLVIRAYIPEYPNPVVGWKTTLNPFQAVAKWSTDKMVWGDITTYGEPRDLAFVITQTQEEVGACCYGNVAIQCIVTTQIDCLTNYPASTWMGVGTNCADVAPPNGIADICEGGPHDEYDFGDAPEGAIAYPSLGTVGLFPTCMTVGPSGFIQHGLGWAHFGPGWDPEPDGNGGLCPGFAPYDNDECFQDTDAGLLFPEPFTIQGGIEVACPPFMGTPLGNPCQTALWGGNIDIDLTNGMPVDGYVNVLIDWDQNGIWGGAATCPGPTMAQEHVLVNWPIPAGATGPLSAFGPPPFVIGPNPGYVWARFTISEQPVVGYQWDGSGVFEDGETEDYLLLIDPDQQPTDDFGDAPDSYTTLLASGGPQHTIQPGIFMGANIDAEWDGIPSANAQGDDTNNIDDEDGITNMSPFVIGQPASFDVTVSVGGMLDVWFDFNADGSFAQPGDQVFGVAGIGVPAGTTTLNFVVPLTATANVATFARFRYSMAGGLPYGGPAGDGEVEDYMVFIREAPHELHSKWVQWPAEGNEGFDAPSDLWWPKGGVEVIKWEQLPNPEVAGVHAHDYDLGDGYQRIIIADDWQCGGGVVTDFHWWGTVEDPGAGCAGFHLSIHDNDPQPCLPMMPPRWEKDVPFSDITVTATGIFNNVGLEIYRYDYYLQEEDWFYQTEGERYWFDLMALSADPFQPYVWIWAEHFRGPLALVTLCPASEWFEPSAPFWKWIFWPSQEWYSDMAFRVTSKDETEYEPNKVVADDWICDGRPVNAVRWWGSYIDPMFQPEEAQEPYSIDGWLISFHHAIEDRDCPPDAAAGDDPTVLGLYWAPAEMVEWTPMGWLDCNGHWVYEYKIDLSQCCLICTEPDPRDGVIPALPDVFEEVQGYRYWLDIQAVVGVEWEEVEPDYCVMQLTSNLPSPNPDLNHHFWGWHTSFGPEAPCDQNNHEACTGNLTNFGSYPPYCWDYENWVKQPWLCPSDPMPVHMAFELLTTDPDPCPTCLGDMNGDNLVNGLDIQCFVNCLIYGPTAGCNCACADFNCTKTPDMGDIAGFVDRLLNYSPPC